ncbi:Crp/Fnr family transcriptional regulator [Acidithiobacillus thiooxidans]|uniref:Crp/Fnr family transcriptional regulator n=1 Tax=Acidithiobacillus thiooxidans TaxID=930 RepID=UPI0028655E7B|nr:Crp/Fnr family transcriptional regulator [Acidithiobacillus thiooxidans]MDR7925977.1 Crp/Fnr family transcriptional regulator [Acidithiobacillus thiooxidans]MDX5934309.1 Crp/Fnr family transcriptional regulator [Acidithiobacillus thiooxidans]
MGITLNDWISHFTSLTTAPDNEKALFNKARPVQWGSDQIIFHAGTPCNQYLLVLEGQIRVQQISAGGREIVLYRIGPGESCILTTACLFSHRPYPAMGITETAVKAISLPKSVFDQLIGQSGLFREFVFNAYGNRLTDLLTLVEEVVFTRLDIRLARKLLDLGKHTQIIHITHQTLATELGSAREVISRALKEFALRGWIRRGSGHIEIIQMQGLQQLANSEFVSSR